MTKLKTIRLYGELGAKFGRVHHMAVSTTAEAIQALSSQIPGFEAYMMTAHERKIGFACFVGKRNLDKEQLGDLTGDQDIRIAPVYQGSKNANIFQIILGVVLIVVGLAISGWSFGTLTPLGGSLVGMGVSMIVGGIVQLLTPMPKTRDQDRKDDSSYVFNGPVNTYAQGNPVPLLYGRMTVGSSVISAGIYTNQIMTGGGSGGGSRLGGGWIKNVEVFEQIQ